MELKERMKYKAIRRNNKTVIVFLTFFECVHHRVDGKSCQSFDAAVALSGKISSIHFSHSPSCKVR